MNTFFVKEIGKLLYPTTTFPHCSGVRQWGVVNKEGSVVNITYPVSYTQGTYIITGSDFNENNNPAVLSFYKQTLSGCVCSGRRISEYNNPNSIDVFGKWVSIGC